MEERIDLMGLNLEELKEVVSSLGEASFRAKQIFNWVYDKKVTDFLEMSNLSKNLREKLIDNAYISQLKVITLQKSKDGTIKYLFELEDGQWIESVFMPYQDNRRSVCISTQVGCGMGCNFCATGLNGLTRNLSTGEIINQIITIARLRGEEITNVVLMGMGEPLANYEEVLKAITLMNDDNGLNIGMRRITLSTCGLVPQIKRLAEEDLQLTLAISLHAPNNKMRSQMMPINDKYPLEDLLDSCRYYIDKTGRRISFEYSLVKGVNDSPKDARELARLLSGILCHVNLIPINQVEGLEYSKPDRDAINNFKAELEQKGVAVTVRLERGADIAAACGQLQAKEGRDEVSNKIGSKA
ncbi:23S rRNA (adenine(2503)-C(2))-methyltransferase [Orenia metallireducens]|jgi:23S rRNA (adenine2503-C2)-methyltransferase|uniref:Probable dual-specificity RNA methyltransferase RlmN n=1 Tax=Orenia metallireducens TaxID=1413210 RepID=A0A1C0AC53_9FIRM|nr:23S rRNA (adenine(2503)-C(2))-methyltransferase RlmN [Orenia metallireducens]OCL27932.1 23S rRNA (adenine(2503)-C(2))-methyltransferase [Orenia metallireducens]